ncbi:histidine kinase [Rhodomicrobium sp. Az07]|uniref:histidine kinase n=1 Tax=Rhodomicrobium sp. Az07 TaxID=2839034 RepID=UPI001BE8D8F9|nr:histidine kinase [Rhodomicrobium sp. Az07]MBT3069581.1 histidine kinase [Rhodomicrobium sp. Az07]
MPHHKQLRLGVMVASASLALLAAGCSSPTGLSDSVEGTFIRAAPTWDLNHDGIVTCDEWRAYVSQLFKEADVNRDEKLSPDEFSRLAKVDRLFETADFKYYDAARKGYVTEADMVDRRNSAFVELDKQNTCRLTTYQLRAATVEQPKKENPAIPGSR